MLCGPLAVQRATGVDYREIVLRLRALREERGVRVSLRGGTHIVELQAAAFERGWRLRRVFRFRRVRLAALAKRVKSGSWIFRQSGHFFGVASGRDLRAMAQRHPTAIVLDGYLVHRVRRASVPGSAE